jgi:limonene-1,2-epoxide hydrolase
MGHREEELIRRVLELWGERDADAMAELFAEDGVYENVPAAEPFRGRDAVRGYLRGCFEHLYVDAEVLHIASDGPWVLSERIDTHVLDPDGRRVPLPVMNVSHVVDGKVELFRDYYDHRMVVSLGLAPQ